MIIDDIHIYIILLTFKVDAIKHCLRSTMDVPRSR